MRNLVFAAAFFAVACASAPRADVTPAPVIAAERAFAARAGEIGWIPAFREYAAPDGHLLGRAGLVSAPERLAALQDDGDRTLYWAPAFAGIARSGDLGFTTGPASFDAARTPAIQYFTVWRRQADGAWKWIYDGGPGAVAEPGPYAGGEPLLLPVAARGAGSAAAAIEQVSAIESGANTGAALANYLAPNAHVYRAGHTRAYGGPESAALMLDPSGEASYRAARVEASAAGDLVFSLGEASWTQDDQIRQGHYARIWQYQSGAWRIVYDQVVVRAPPAAN